MLRIVAWDDPRCVQPLEAACKDWSALHAEECRIISRPLTAFNDQPLSELSPICDVMIIDYPHVAQAIEERAITAISDLLPPAAIESLRAGAIGPAQDSFVVDGRDVALASDVACQVAAFGPEILDGLDATPPADWSEVFALAERHLGSGAVPLYHTDAVSCVFSLTAGADAAPDGGAAFFPDRDRATTEDAIDLLTRLASCVEPACWDCTPQKLYAHAATGRTIAYLPLTFGYTWLTAADKGGWRFGAPPAGCGSLLGAAGMAVSSQATDDARAAAFVEWYCSADCQRQVAFNAGQPAGRVGLDRHGSRRRQWRLFQRYLLHPGKRPCAASRPLVASGPDRRGGSAGDIDALQKKRRGDSRQTGGHLLANPCSA